MPVIEYRIYGLLNYEDSKALNRTLVAIISAGLGRVIDGTVLAS